MKIVRTTTVQNIARIVLGSFMILAGVSHLAWSRQAFHAQVPNWIPINKDTVVILSGIVEIALGSAMVFAGKRKVQVGIALAIFYVLIFPGNIAQYVNDIDSFGLNTDGARLARLFFQPVLIFVALWSTGFFSAESRSPR